MKKASASKKNEKSRTILLDGSRVPYLLRHHPRARHIRFSVSVEKGLVVVTPPGIKVATVEPLLRERKEWILEKVAYYADLRQQLAAQLVDSPPSSAHLLGREYRLQITLDAAAKPCARMLPDDTINLVVGSQEQLQVVLNSFLRAKAEIYLLQRVEQLATEYGFKFHSVKVRETRSRWGSCSAAGNLSFCWQLVTMPPEIIDYVIIHELCHLEQMNHSPLFWKLVENYCPDYRQRRAWLKQNGSRLPLPGKTPLL